MHSFSRQKSGRYGPCVAESSRKCMGAWVGKDWVTFYIRIQWEKSNWEFYRYWSNVMGSYFACSVMPVILSSMPKTKKNPHKSNDNNHWWTVLPAIKSNLSLFLVLYWKCDICLCQSISERNCIYQLDQMRNDQQKITVYDDAHHIIVFILLGVASSA